MPHPQAKTDPRANHLELFNEWEAESLAQPSGAIQLRDKNIWLYETIELDRTLLPQITDAQMRIIRTAETTVITIKPPQRFRMLRELGIFFFCTIAGFAVATIFLAVPVFIVVSAFEHDLHFSLAIAFGLVALGELLVFRILATTIRRYEAHT